jgi:tRNA G37 N-methylase Trm5
VHYVDFVFVMSVGACPRVIGAGLENVADRVMLGLIPSSEFAWPTAVHVLKPQVRVSRARLCFVQLV